MQWARLQTSFERVSGLASIEAQEAYFGGGDKLYHLLQKWVWSSGRAHRILAVQVVKVVLPDLGRIKMLIPGKCCINGLLHRNKTERLLYSSCSVRDLIPEMAFGCRVWN